MLNQSLLNRILKELPEFTDNHQILEGDGYDAVIDLLGNLRSVKFPAVILESRSSGVISIVEGPLDRSTQSIWVMGQLGRDENEAALYDSMFELTKKVISKLLAYHDTPELHEWNHSRISYMKRYGGQNARGYEIILNFEENIGL